MISWSDLSELNDCGEPNICWEEWIEGDVHSVTLLDKYDWSLAFLQRYVPSD